jgi:hypothetical protein
VATAITRGPQREEPDGIPVKPGVPSGSASLYVAKEGGAHWLWGAWQHLSGRQLEFNDLGYLERKNDYQAYVDVAYRTLEPWRGTRETRTTLQLQARETLDGINLWNAVELNTWFNLSSFWSFYVEAHYRGAHFDDREMGDGAALQRAGLVGVEVSVASDPRRRITAWVFAQAHRLANGAHTEARASLTFRLLPQLELDFAPTGTYDSGEPRWVSTDGGASPSYLFGVQEARSVGATLRVAYTFTPDLSLQLYAQPFLARVHYSSFLTYPAPAYRQRVRLGDLVSGAPAPTTNPDSQQAALNVNAVLRWEYRPGSTLFLVYTRSQNPSLVVPRDGAAALDLHPVLQGKAAVDVVMVKLAYWWG